MGQAGAAAALLLPAVLHAHAPSAADAPPSLATAWTLDPWLLVPLLLLLGLHALALHRFSRRRSTRVSRLGLAAVTSGWLLLVLVLVGPLDALGEWSLAIHMSQHMLLMAFVPPLLLLGLPPAAALHAASRRAQRLLRPLLAWASSPSRWGGGVGMTVVTAANVAVMWLWHWPPLLQAALLHDLLHYLMHASFLLAGVAFWWCLRLSLQERTLGYAGGAAALISVMMGMGLLGGLLTFGRRVLYPFYDGRVDQLGFDALADQQLAGLIMWVPATLPYLLGGLWLLYRWLVQLERRSPATDTA